MKIVYLDKNFNPTTKEKATIAKVFPSDGSRPYFISVNDDR